MLGRSPSIAIIGSALYGNQGAAAMLVTSLQELSKTYPNAEFSLLSLYPELDHQKNKFRNLTVYNAKPLYLTFVIIPLAVCWKILPFLRHLFTRNNSLRALAEADIILDQGGITFVDGRGAFLIYNVASLLPGVVMSRKIIKCSQAIGPFKNFTNRLAAKYFLPRMYHIFARGNQTALYLKTLGLTNFSVAADYSFLLQTLPKERAKVDKLFKQLKVIPGDKLVGISPSSVVDKKCHKLGIDYPEVLISFIEWLSKNGYNTIIIPHSVRKDGKLHNNDLPLARQLFNAVKIKKDVQLIEENMSPAELRYIISKCGLLVASRFHAMVSGLASGVPTIVIGWSHKYQEVIDMFDVSISSIAYTNLTNDKLQTTFQETYQIRSNLRKKLNQSMESVIKSAQNNTSVILEAIEQE